MYSNKGQTSVTSARYTKAALCWWKLTHCSCAGVKKIKGTNSSQHYCGCSSHSCNSQNNVKKKTNLYWIEYLHRALCTVNYVEYCLRMLKVKLLVGLPLPVLWTLERSVVQGSNNWKQHRPWKKKKKIHLSTEVTFGIGISYCLHDPSVTFKVLCCQSSINKHCEPIKVSWTAFEPRQAGQVLLR